MNLETPLKDSYWTDVEDQIKAIFYSLVYEPIEQLLTEYTDQMRFANQILNAGESALREALRSGRVQYLDGLFTGDFNATIAKALRGFGAKFNPRARTYSISSERVPEWVRAEAGVYQALSKQVHSQLKKTLGYIQAGLEQLVQKSSVDASAMFDKMSRDFIPISKHLEIYPEVTEATRAQMSKSFSEDLKAYIYDHSADMLDDIYEAVESNAMQGFRFDRLINIIKSREGVSASKAKFLARQEAGIYMAKFRQGRFKEAGVTHYTWSTSADERVRDDHKHLNGRVFSYKSPPIVDKATGRRANPGEDFNCRCIDIPVLGSLAEVN